MKTPHILVIDDDNEVRQTICDMLAASDFVTTSAKDGEEGLIKFAQGQFNLIITDILMPNKEGIETIVEIRRTDPKIKILAISGGDGTGNIIFLDMAERLGADATLKKPFTSAKLLQAVNNILQHL